MPHDLKDFFDKIMTGAAWLWLIEAIPHAITFLSSVASLIWLTLSVFDMLRKWGWIKSKQEKNHDG